MKTQIEYVTPAMARRWLEHNTENRRIRPWAIKGFHDAWKRGEWRTTHQGVAFSKTGRLLDGQHRLTFISQLEDGITVPINVTRDCDDDLFGVIDRGQVRTLSDVSGFAPAFVAVGSFFAKIWNSSQTTGLTPQLVMPFIEWAAPTLQELLTFTPANAQIWSSAAVRCAAIYQIEQGHDVDFVKVSYDSLVRADIDAMPNGARALMQQRMSGKIVSARNLDLFVRALRAFDSTQKQKIKSILVTNSAKVLLEVRQSLDVLIEKSPGNAGQKVAKPAANSKVKRVA